MKYISLLMILSILIGSTHGSSLQDDNRLDDDAITQNLYEKANSYWTQSRGTKNTKYEILSIERIYELPPRRPIGALQSLRHFSVLTTLKRTKISKKHSTETKTKYVSALFDYIPGSKKFKRSGVRISLDGWSTYQKYQQAISAYDKSKNSRILYPKELRKEPKESFKPICPKSTNADPGQLASKSHPLVLLFFASDPSPAVAGKDFRLLFDWSVKPDSVYIEIYDPSGKCVMRKTIEDENEVLFSAKVYMKFLTERGKYTIDIQVRKTGYKDWRKKLTLDIVDSWGCRGWFTLGQPDKKVMYFGEKVFVKMLDVCESYIPVNIYLINDKGTEYNIYPPHREKDLDICEFDSLAFQRVVTNPGTYRFKVETVFAGKHYITRYSDPFQYFVADDSKKEVSFDGRTYVLRIDPEASSSLRYYGKTSDGLRRCDEIIDERLQKLASLKDSEDEEIWTVTPWLKRGRRSYAVFAFCAKGASLETYKPGQVFWLNKQGLRQTGIKRLVILDELSQVVTDTDFAKSLFRAAFVYYQAKAVSNSGLIINSEDINYVRSMTNNPAFAATFSAQAGKSLLTLPEERYNALFLDVMLAETNDVYLTREQRKTIAQSLESGGDINKALSTYAKIARRLPSNYIEKLDENLVMVRRGEQWHFLERKNMPNVGRGIRLLEVAVELTHNQIVLQDRAKKLDLINSEIINYTPSGKSRAMKIGAQEALQWSDKAYKSGLSNALDKAVDVAKKEGIEAALKLLGQMSSKANSVLLAFEIPNVVFNMDSMYDSNIKAQCAADISEAINDALITAVKKAERYKNLEDWEHVDALYLFAYLAKERFHYHAANMLESSGIGKDAGDFLTQGKTTQWITSQKNTGRGISSMIEYWENQEGINDCTELMVTQVSSK